MRADLKGLIIGLFAGILIIILGTLYTNFVLNKNHPDLLQANQ